MKLNFNQSSMNFAMMSNLQQTVKFDQMKEKVDSQNEHRYANPYENDPRNGTGRTDWKKIVPVSDQVKEDLIHAVRESMEERGGMSSVNVDNNPILKIKLKYINSVPPTEQSSVGYTLDQISINEAQRLVDFVREKVPVGIIFV